MYSYRYIGSSNKYYQYGETYTLHIKRRLFSDHTIPILSRVWIWAERGKGNTIPGSRTRYKNEEDFNHSWVPAHI